MVNKVDKYTSAEKLFKIIQQVLKFFLQFSEVENSHHNRVNNLCS